MSTIDKQVRIQRLVDGELDSAERARFLRSIADDSKSWRNLALAFVERQVLDESLAKKSVNERPESVVMAELENAASRDQRRIGGAIGWSGRRRSRLVTSTFLAAVVGSLLCGMIFGEFHARRSSVSSTVVERNNSPAHDSLASHDSSGIPLADALSRTAAPIPVDFRRELMKQGYLITERDQLSKVRLPTGQLVDMPVRQVAVTYLGNVTYQ